MTARELLERAPELRGLGTLVSRCVAVDPTDRVVDMVAVARELRALLAHTDDDTAAFAPRTIAKRHRTEILAGSGHGVACSQTESVAAPPPPVPRRSALPRFAAAAVLCLLIGMLGATALQAVGESVAVAPMTVSRGDVCPVAGLSTLVSPLPIPILVAADPARIETVADRDCPSPESVGFPPSEAIATAVSGATHPRPVSRRPRRPTSEVVPPPAAEALEEKVTAPIDVPSARPHPSDLKHPFPQR